MVAQKTAVDFNSSAYKRSRWAYTIECGFEYFVSLLVTGSLLSKLLSAMGMNDALVGIISSFISLAFLFQLFSVFVVQRIVNTKRFVIIFHSLSQIFFMSLYLIPFLPFEYKHKELIVILSILAAYFGNYFVTSMIYQWGNSFVEPHKRARFSATKEMISLACGVVVTLTAGYVMDYFELIGRLDKGFIFAAVAIFIFAICDFICLMLIKNKIKEPEEIKERASLKDVIKNTLGNKKFINIAVLQILWDIGRYMTVGFIGTYCINEGELNFNVGTVLLITNIGCAARFVVSRPFGRYSDKRSFAKGIELGLVFASLSFVISAFMSPATRYLFIAYTIFNNVCYAGISQNLLNITYSYVDSKYIAEAMAIKNSIGGIFGFGASLLASAILSGIQANGNTLFGLHVYGQQVLSVISFVILVAAIIFTRTVIEKQKVMVQ